MSALLRDPKRFETRSYLPTTQAALIHAWETSGRVRAAAGVDEGRYVRMAFAEPATWTGVRDGRERILSLLRLIAETGVSVRWDERIATEAQPSRGERVSFYLPDQD